MNEILYQYVNGDKQFIFRIETVFSADVFGTMKYQFNDILLLKDGVIQ